MRHGAAEADDRVDALPREHPERGGVRRVAADEVDDDVDAGAVRQLARGARDVRVLAEHLVRAELAREPPAALVGVDATTFEAPSTRTSCRPTCPTPPMPITAAVLPGSRRGTSFLTAWYAVMPASACGATAAGSTPPAAG